MQAHAALVHEDEALAHLAQDIEVVALVRMQAQEHRPPFGAQAAEEVEHEADVAVLGVELRLVEEVHHGIGRLRGLQEKVGAGAPELPHLVGLVVVDGKAIALPRLDGVDVLAHAQHAARARQVGPGDELEQRGLAGAVRPHHAHDLRALHAEVGLEPEGGAPAPAVLLHHVFYVEDHQMPRSCSRKATSLARSAAGPWCTTLPLSMT
jgi:hypothetical protein